MHMVPEIRVFQISADITMYYTMCKRRMKQGDSFFRVNEKTISHWDDRD